MLVQIQDLLKYNVGSNTRFAQILCWFEYKFCSNTMLVRIQDLLKYVGSNTRFAQICWFKYKVSSNVGLNAMLVRIQGLLKFNVSSNTITAYM